MIRNMPPLDQDQECRDRKTVRAASPTNVLPGSADLRDVHWRWERAISRASYRRCGERHGVLRAANPKILVADAELHGRQLGVSVRDDSSTVSEAVLRGVGGRLAAHRSGGTRRDSARPTKIGGAGAAALDHLKILRFRSARTGTVRAPSRSTFSALPRHCRSWRAWGIENLYKFRPKANPISVRDCSDCYRRRGHGISRGWWTVRPVGKSTTCADWPA